MQKCKSVIILSEPLSVIMITDQFSSFLHCLVNPKQQQNLRSAAVQNLPSNLWAGASVDWITETPNKFEYLWGCSITFSFENRFMPFFRCRLHVELSFTNKRTSIFEGWRRWKSALHAEIQHSQERIIDIYRFWASYGRFLVFVHRH